MKYKANRLFVALLFVTMIFAAGSTTKMAFATPEIRCLVISDLGADLVAADFGAHMTGISFDSWDDHVIPDLLQLQQYDVVLLYECYIPSNAPDVGYVIYEYVMKGGNLVIGTFYEQGRSDNLYYSPPGWGKLEEIDVFTSDTKGCKYTADSMDPATIVPHPIMYGVSTLWGAYVGGNSPKPDTTVLAYWSSPNYLGEPDPAVGCKTVGDSRLVHIAIFPDYPSYGTYDVDFGGDFYRLWENAIRWAAVGTAIITGVIFDKTTGEPLAGANITANGYTYITGPDGKYTLIVPTGNYTLTVSKEGYGTNTTSVTVSPGEIRTIDLIITNLATITGVVTDKDTGALISGATVAVDDAQITTGADGEYSFTLLPGSYSITVSKQGYVTNTTPVTVGAGETKTVNIAIARLAILTGTITDKKTGNPISGATVKADSVQNTTGADGKYWLILPPGTYNLTVTKSGYVVNFTSVSATSGVTQTVNLSLREPLGTITGVVTDKKTGAFVVGATVKADSTQTTTGSDGKYTLNVEAGTYTVTVTMEGYDKKSSSVTVGAGVTQTANFVVSPSAGFPLVYVIAGVGGAAAIAAVVLLLKRKPKPPKEKVPMPAALRITADPTEVLSDGKSTSTITIELLDEEDKPIQAPKDTEVRLTTTLGRITSPLTISKGEATGKATLTSSTEFGGVKVSAESRGLKGASTTLTFVERKRYCMHCGTKMPLDAKVCPRCGNAPPSGVDVKVCPNCKEVIPIVAKFCSNCGASQPAETKEKTS